MGFARFARPFLCARARVPVPLVAAAAPPAGPAHRKRSAGARTANLYTQTKTKLFSRLEKFVSARHQYANTSFAVKLFCAFHTNNLHLVTF